MKKLSPRRLWTRALAPFLLVAFAACGDSDTPDPDGGTTNPDAQTADAGSEVPDATAPVDSGVVPPGCGDGVLATNEACEGFELRGETCATQGFSSGQLRCTNACTLDTSACVRCGNDTVEEGEVCDGTDLAGGTCASLLGSGYSGTVSCAEDCRGHVTDACQLALPPGELASCTSTAASPCANDLSCVTTARGDFCLESCDEGVAGDCDPADVCLDVGPPRTPTFACVARPEPGDVCTSATGCVEGSCQPTFSDGTTVTSICADECTIVGGTEGRGDCPSGYACAPNPAGFIEEQAGAITCTVTTVTRDCNTTDGYECLQVGQDAAGGPTLRCARYLRHCVPPQDFFGFDASIVPEDARCDLAGPSSGGRYCGLLGTITEDPARVRCFPLFEGVTSVGACVGFCDSVLSADGQTDLDCGTAGTCVLPSEPQFFFPQDPPVFCTAGDPVVCSARTGFDRCVDFGSGLQCARPSKVCAPVGG